MNSNDQLKAFESYLFFAGDVPRTAIACGASVQAIKALEMAGNWKERAREWNELKAGSSADLAIAVNRGNCFVQSTRLKALLDKVIDTLAEDDGPRLVDRFTTVTKAGGSSFSARALTDLVKAAESVQLMLQRSLGDTVAERPDAEASRKGSSIALLVSAALSASDGSGIDTVAACRQLTTPTATPDASLHPPETAPQGG